MMGVAKKSYSICTQCSRIIIEDEMFVLRAIARLMYKYSKDKMNTDKLEAMKIAKTWYRLYGRKQRKLDKE